MIITHQQKKNIIYISAKFFIYFTIIHALRFPHETNVANIYINVNSVNSYSIECGFHAVESRNLFCPAQMFNGSFQKQYFCFPLLQIRWE